MILSNVWIVLLWHIGQNGTICNNTVLFETLHVHTSTHTQTDSNNELKLIEFGEIATKIGLIFEQFSFWFDANVEFVIAY